MYKPQPPAQPVMCKQCFEDVPVDDNPTLACPKCGLINSPTPPVIPTPKPPQQNRNLRTCRDCGHLVSVNAESCPSCGAKIPKKTSTFTWVVAAVLGFLLVAFILGVSSEAKKPTKPIPAKIQFSDTFLYIRNAGAEDWPSGVTVYINGMPPFTYHAQMRALAVDQSAKIFLDDFAKDNGERFDPARFKITDLWIGGAGFDYSKFGAN